MPGDNQIKKTEITRLISKGRKQGFLLFEEVDKTFQEEMGSGDDFNEFLSSMGDYGIQILERKRTTRPKRRKSNIVSLEGLERTTDPVKLYLREMGNISLLTREGEIAIAREIERGEKNIIKALSKTKMVLNEALSLEDRLEDEPEILQEMFDFTDADIAEGKIEEKKQQIMGKIHDIEGLSKKLDKIRPLKRNIIPRGRIIVEMSGLIRDLNFRSFYREQVIETLREKLKVINELEESRDELQVMADQTRGVKRKAELEQKIKEINKLLRTYEKEVALDSAGLRKTLRAITTGKSKGLVTWSLAPSRRPSTT